MRPWLWYKIQGNAKQINNQGNLIPYFVKFMQKIHREQSIDILNKDTDGTFRLPWLCLLHLILLNSAAGICRCVKPLRGTPSGWTAEEAAPSSGMCEHSFSAGELVLPLRLQSSVLEHCPSGFHHKTKGAVSQTVAALSIASFSRLSVQTRRVGPLWLF